VLHFIISGIFTSNKTSGFTYIEMERSHTNGNVNESSIGNSDIKLRSKMNIFMRFGVRNNVER
jgi:hypothetical protein